MRSTSESAASSVSLAVPPKNVKDAELRLCISAGSTCPKTPRERSVSSASSRRGAASAALMRKFSSRLHSEPSVLKYSSRSPSVMRWPSRYAPSLTCVPYCAAAMASSISSRHSSWASGVYQAQFSGERPVSVTPRLTLSAAGSDDGPRRYCPAGSSRTFPSCPPPLHDEDGLLPGLYRPEGHAAVAGRQDGGQCYEVVLVEALPPHQPAVMQGDVRPERVRLGQAGEALNAAAGAACAFIYRSRGRPSPPRYPTPAL